ncbi:MAG: YIP1 family protein [Acidobacteria bacterium]|nr:YIP1 family protein [Acidobacteriota bacterium]MCA1651868.1 YIP1 family protein [Acidobacteriota bacterium]
MTTLPVETGPSPAPQGLVGRFIGVITSPRATFAAIVAHPRWFGMLALTTIAIAILTAAPMTTKAGQEAALETQVSQMEAFGVEVNDEMYARMEQGMGRAAYTTAAGVLVMSPLFALIVAGVLFAVFNGAMGGEASFKQIFAVVVHAGVISVLAQLFTAPVNLARGTMGSATNLGVLLPMIDEKSFAGRLLGMIDLFIIWYVIVLAIGLAVLYRRRTQPIAMTLLGAYAVLALVFAAVMSRMGGTGQ